MTIVKFAKRNRFTSISNTTVWDPDLNLSEVGLLVRILSRPDDWVIHLRELARSCGCSVGLIQKMIKKFVDLGYVLREAQQRKERGKFSSINYVVYEERQPVIQEISPQTVLRCTVPRGTVNRHILNTNPNQDLPNQSLCKQRETLASSRPSKSRKLKSSTVQLTEAEREKLDETYGREDVAQWIVWQNNHCASKGLSFCDWPATARNWFIREEKWGRRSKTSNPSSKDEDQKLLTNAFQKYGRHFETGRWQLGYNYIEEVFGEQPSRRTHPGDDGFKDLLIKVLRSKNYDIPQSGAGSPTSGNDRAAGQSWTVHQPQNEVRMAASQACSREPMPESRHTKSASGSGGYC
jgi:hypothetical protein